MKTGDSWSDSGSSWQRRARLFAFCLYASCSLISQATMSIGVALLFAGILVGAGGPRGLGRQLRALLALPGARAFFWVSAAFVLVIGLSLVGTWLWPVVYNGKAAEVSFPVDIGKTWYFIAPFVTAAGVLAMTAAERRIVLKTWLITFLAVSLVGFVQFFTGWPRAQAIPTLPEYFHAVLFFGHHLSTASILIFPLFAVLDLLSRPGGWREIRLSRALLAGILVAGAVTLFLTFSRALWGALPIALVAWSIFRFGRKAMFAAIAILLVVAAASQIPAVNRRLTKGASLSDREELWIANLDFFKARPVLGVGFRKNHQMSGYYLKQKYPKRTWIFAGHAHNNLLDMLGGLGLLGALVWLAWSGLVVWLPYRAWRLGAGEAAFPSGLIAAWVAFQVNGVTQVNFWEGKVMHQMMWAAAWGLAFYAIASARAGEKGRA